MRRNVGERCFVQGCFKCLLKRLFRKPRKGLQTRELMKEMPAIRDQLLVSDRIANVDSALKGRCRAVWRRATTTGTRIEQVKGAKQKDEKQKQKQKQDGERLQVREERERERDRWAGRELAGEEA